MNIVLVSEAGGGKDFLSDYLITKYGYTRYAFADNVKLMAETWFPELYGDGTSKPRSLLQAVGTKFREINPKVWINAMFDDIDKAKRIREQYGDLQEFIVITDCRMPNEYEALKEREFVFIRINVDEDTRQQRLINRGDSFTSTDMKHHTESFYDSFECDYIIDNNGTKEEVFASLDNIIESLMEMNKTAK